MGKISTQQIILPKGIKMQFKTLAFLSILSILFFTGCDSKDKNDNSNETNETKIEKVDKKTEFQLKSTDNTLLDVKVEGNNVVVKNYPVPMEFLGIKDVFGQSGEPEEQETQRHTGYGNPTGGARRNRWKIAAIAFVGFEKTHKQRPLQQFLLYC